MFHQYPIEVDFTLDLRSIRRLELLGEVCCATGQLPTLISISSGLRKRGALAVAAGGLTDMWEGEHNRERVAAKTFRAYPIASMAEAKKVQLKCAKS